MLCEGGSDCLKSSTNVVNLLVTTRVSVLYINVSVVFSGSLGLNHDFRFL